MSELSIEIGAKLNKLDKALAQLDQKMDKANKGLVQKSNQSGKQIDQAFGRALSNVGTKIIAVFAVDRIASFTNEAIALAGKLEGIESGFKKLNNPALLDELRQATKGTVSDIELMRKAVQANNFKVPLDQLGTFFRFATNRAAETGESVEYLTESVISGIGRKSILVMDNLGISAAELQEEIKKTGDFGMAAANIIEREMAKAGDVMLTTAQKTEQTRVQFENLKASIGQKLLPVYNKFLVATNQVLDGLDSFIDLTQSEGVTGMDKFQLALQRSAGGAQSLGNMLAWLRGKTEEQIIATAAETKARQKQVDEYQAYHNALEDEKKRQKELAAAKSVAADESARAAAKELEYAKAIEKSVNAEMKRAMLAGFSRGTSGAGGRVSGDDDAMALSELEEADQIAEKFVETIDAAKIKAGSLSGQMMQLGGTLTNVFSQALMDGENFAEVFGKFIENLLKRIAAAAIAAATLSLILRSLGVPTGAFGGGGGQLSFLSLFQGLSGIPKFAKGGIVTGPTLAMVGDNPSGKEAIIPLEKMGALMGGLQTIQVYGRIRGNDIVLANERGGRTRQRRRGF